MGELERMARDVFELTYDLVVLEDNVEDIKRKVIVKYLKAWSQENKLQIGNISFIVIATTSVPDLTGIQQGPMDSWSGFLINLLSRKAKIAS